MSLASLITQRPIRTKFKDREGKVDIFVVDVTISETPTYENEVTENPVEDGLDVNDHIRAKPVSVSIEGFVSEAPLTLADDLEGSTISSKLKNIAGGFATTAGAVAGKALGGKYASTVGAVAGGQIGTRLMQSTGNMADIAREKLEAMITDQVIFTLVTKRKKYENMTVVSLTFPRDSSSGQGLRFSMKCREINIVQTEDVKITNIRSDVAAGAPKKDLGNQNAKDATKSSVALKLGSAAVEYVKGILK